MIFFFGDIQRVIATFQLTMDAQRARGYELDKISGGLISQIRKLAPIFFI